VLQEFLIFL
jgi:hypothetical protein